MPLERSRRRERRTRRPDRNGCIRRLLPRSTRPSRNLRRVGVRNFTDPRPAQASLVRPARSLNRPRRHLLQGFDPAGYPTKPPVGYRIKPTPIRVDPSSTGVTRRRGALKYPGWSAAPTTRSGRHSAPSRAPTRSRACSTPIYGNRSPSVSRAARRILELPGCIHLEWQAFPPLRMISASSSGATVLGI